MKPRVDLPAGVSLRTERLGFTYQLPRGRGRSRDASVEDDDDDLEGGEDPEAETPPASDRRVEALKDVNFSVPTGAAAVVLGGAGAGKTTLMKVLGETRPATRGRMVMRLPVVGPITNLHRFLEGRYTGNQNLRLIAHLHGAPRRWIADNRAAVAELAGAQDLIDVPFVRWPEPMSALFTLSALLRLNPALLLVDGPFAHVGTALEDRFEEVLSARREQGMTTVIAARDPRFLRERCDWAIWLESGTVKAFGPASDILDSYVVPRTEAAVLLGPQRL